MTIVQIIALWASVFHEEKYAASLRAPGVLHDTECNKSATFGSPINRLIALHWEDALYMLAVPHCTRDSRL